MIKGKALMIMIGSASASDTIAMATSCSASLSSDMTDVATKDDNDKFNYQEITGQSWTLSSENLIPANDEDVAQTYDTLKEYIQNGTELYVAFSYLPGAMGKATETGTWNGVTGVTPEAVFTGKAIITSLSLNAANKSNATMSATFTGKGALTIA